MDFRVDVAIRTSGKDKIDSLEKQIRQLKNSSVKLNFTTDATSEIANLKRQIAELQAQRIRVRTDTSNAKSDFQILKNLANEISQKQIKIAGLDTSKNSNQIVTLTSQLKKLQSDYKVLYSTLGKNLNTSQIGQLENIFGKTTDRVNELNAKAKDLASTMSKAAKPFNSLDAMTASNKTLAWLNNNTKAAKDYGEALTQLAAKQKAATNSAELAQYNKEFRNIVSQAQLAGKTGRSFVDDFRQAFGRIFQFAGAYGLIQNVVWQIPRQMIQAVRDINSAQIELRKVSEASNAQLTAYWDEAATSAQKYGATISDVISSTADWSRLGYNLDDSKILSDLTTLYQRVGDNMTQESASEALISTLQGYQMTANQAEHIVDAFNEVGNKFAIGSDGIGEALQRSASSMYAANNTMEETIGLVTAANTVVQDPDSVGTAFKTISMRIRGATTELEEAGLETEGMAESTASLRKEIMALSGVDIMQDENTFKSTYDILDELATKWSDLTDIQQANSCLYVQKCA